jgi:hypothetical protein
MKRNLLTFASIKQSPGGDLINIGIIVAIWIVMVILVNPIGDFPLNDDWAYAYSVKVLLEQGDFRLSGWTATNLFPQVLWGALFSLPFGFSFTALRFSTLTLGLIGVLATYGLLREVGAPTKLAHLGALLVAVNPIYFSLSNTFMNDVPFAAIATLSLYFLLRGLKYHSNLQIVIGMLIAGIAILTRQIGLAIPVAFGCAFLIKRGVNKQNLFKAVWPIIMSFALQLVYQKWLELTLRTPLKYGNQIKTLLAEVSKGLDNVVFNFYTITLYSLIYLGLFLFPFVLLLFLKNFERLSFRNRLLSLTGIAFFFTGIMSVLLSGQELMPLRGNILIDLGIGPAILKNSEPVAGPKIFWLITTGVGVLGAAFLLFYLCLTIIQIFDKYQRREFAPEKWVNVIIMAAMGIYYLPLGFLGLGPFGFYDRYLLFLIPLLITLVSISSANLNQWLRNYKFFIPVALAIIVLYGFFTVGAVHDYLSWNRARWQALRHLMEDEGISPRYIDGGFEFNGWYLYDDTYQYDPTFVKSWYWVDHDDYVVSFTHLTGYEEIKRYPFKRLLPGGARDILILHRASTLLH